MNVHESLLGSPQANLLGGPSAQVPRPKQDIFPCGSVWLIYRLLPMPPSSIYVCFNSVDAIFCVFRVVSSILIQPVHFLGWKWKHTYLRDETDLILQSRGSDFLAKSFVHVFQFYCFVEAVDSNICVKNLTFVMGLQEAAWGNICVMPFVSFQVFIQMWFWHAFCRLKSMFS